MNINYIDTIKKYFSLNIYTGILLLIGYYIIQAGWINFTFANVYTLLIFQNHWKD